MNNTWESIEDVLYDGSAEDIKSLTCPDCHSTIYFEYSPKFRSLQFGCKKCQKVIRETGCHQVPNCANV